MAVSQRQRRWVHGGAWLVAAGIFVLAAFGVPRLIAHAASSISEPNGIGVTVNPSGAYTITATTPA